ncbi:hypothetical protein LX15_004615 [Streptoalloteichus tenebrarius]|uniref:Pycsar effector protein domain-containing protein n=1 Tax=Streptoalloteichus tenebrarius (strain ATCC 17920 / DSM 40477 / JCM 4838 / CBS 697.72 / NBRC 16177 / NCIMB 11028 / NRRL B-12390 / A12253. 1 / ISP 5477) TaxID=1933 RepID=A0ABT1HZH4_STRSD|nr:Pycsar system effector family protein [Streptoalloteichus tenebrarius]MCP2260895.1 hypothetical protein [Streptoalloteichus tenebrarius]BFF03344.1 hypothetical protein GCM10020241_50190 [Streptoalloteichus tenebrarius]
MHPPSRGAATSPDGGRRRDRPDRPDRDDGGGVGACDEPCEVVEAGRAPVAPVPGGPLSTEDARFAMTHFASWIGNADTKAGLLAAATTVLAGAVVGQRAAVVAALTRPTGWRVVALVGLGLSVVGVVVTTLFLIRAVAPRVRQDGFSRYSWPTVADTSLSGLMATDPEGDRREAWLSALTLARIVRRKYANLRCAFVSWLISVTGLTVWLIIAP